MAISNHLLNKQDLSQELQFCAGCSQGKQLCLKVGRSEVPRPLKRLQLVTSDVCGPFPPSLSGARYFCTFNDSHSRRTIVAILKHKGKVFDKFKVFEATATKEIFLHRSRQRPSLLHASFSTGHQPSPWGHLHLRKYRLE